MNYKNFRVRVKRDFYRNNNRPAILLVDAVDGSPIATATTNVPEIKLGPGETCIKNYSENEGMLDWLVKNGIVEDTGTRVQAGFAVVPVVKVK